MTPQERYLTVVLLRVLAELDRPALLGVAYAVGLVQQMPKELSTEDMRVFLYGQLCVPSKENLRKAEMDAVRT